MAGILIKNGKLWDGERFCFADLLTDGNAIAKIGQHLTDEADFVFDATGMIVSAGLVDTHVHMKGVASDEFGIEPHMSSFPFGVTAVNDAGSVFGDKALLDSFSVKNMVFVGTDIRDNHADFSNTETYLKKYGDKAIGIKVYFDTTLCEVRDITPLREVCDYAHERGLKVMVHCSHSPTTMAAIVDTLSAGDILTHIFHGGENACTDNDFEAFILAKQKGVVLDAGFAGFVHTDFAVLQRAVTAGFLPDTVSTDITCCSAYKRGGRYGMTMCMNLAKTAGMSEEQIFKAVTTTPASVLGKANDWGRLQVGRCADIAVFKDTNEGFDLTDRAGNRYHSDTGYRCVLTVCDGQVVFKD